MFASRVMPLVLFLALSAPLAARAECQASGVELLLAKARKQAEQGQWPEAVATYEELLKIDEAQAEAHHELGVALLHLRARRTRDMDAAVHYRRAIELRPDRSAFYETLGDHYLRLGYGLHALGALMGGLEVAKTDAERYPLYMLLGDLGWEERDLNRALGHYSSAQAACGDCSGPQLVVHFRRGFTLFTLGRAAEAAPDLTRFEKLACKGAAASRYASQCGQTAVLLERIERP